jgi:hypothetical protein
MRCAAADVLDNSLDLCQVPRFDSTSVAVVKPGRRLVQVRWGLLATWYTVKLQLCSTSLG